MKKKILIVNILFLVFLVGFSFITREIYAQSLSPALSPTVSPVNNNQSIELLKSLLNLLFSFGASSSFPQTGSTGTTAPNSILPTTPINQPTTAPAASGKMSQITYWTQQITQNLTGETRIWPPSNYFNILLTPPSNGSYRAFYAPATDLTNLYWCTFLVVDAYNLASFKGLDLIGQGDVIAMQNFFGNTPGYSLISFPGDNPSGYIPAVKVAILNQVQPGSAIFFNSIRGVHNGAEHVGVVASILVDSFGNGLLTTYESNNVNGVNFSYPIYQGDIVNVPHPVIGFGWVN